TVEGERLAQERLRLVIVPAVGEEEAEVHHGLREVGVVRCEELPAKGERAAEVGLGLLVLAERLAHRSELVLALGHVRVALPEGGAADLQRALGERESALAVSEPLVDPAEDEEEVSLDGRLRGQLRLDALGAAGEEIEGV